MAVPFTYFGDLLGIGEAYRRGSQAATSLLDIFYSTAFRVLPDPDRDDLRIQMYSDSLTIWGRDCARVLPGLACLYRELLQEGILLRGGMAYGYLEFELRVERQGFQKNLPNSDILARAATYEKMLKGSRCAVESKLAAELLADRPSWLTAQGFAVASQRGETRFPNAEWWKLALAPVPDSDCHELLYLWQDASNHARMEANKKLLKNIQRESATAVAEQYDQTIKLIDRTAERRKMVGGD